MGEFKRALGQLKAEVAEFITKTFEPARLCPAHKIALGDTRYFAGVEAAKTPTETQQAVAELEGFLETLRTRAKVQEVWGGYLEILRAGKTKTSRRKSHG